MENKSWTNKFQGMLVKESKTTPISVALLIKDIKKAQELTKRFRLMGIIPSYFDCLKNFWTSMNQNTPTFAMVDVQLMSEDSLVLKNHPSIVNMSLPILFYYTEDTKPLIQSTYSIFHYGLIKEGDSLTHEIKGILWRINHNQKRVIASQKQKREVVRLQGKVNGLIKLQDRKNIVANIDTFVERLSKKIDNCEQDADFFKRVEYSFSEMPEIQEFSFLELTRNGQKLISPEGTSHKYCKLPTLWQDKTLQNGIEDFAINSAVQVAAEVLGEDLAGVRINGLYANPSILIFIRFKSEFQEEFDSINWMGLDHLLSDCFRRDLIKKMANIPMGNERIMVPWDFLSLMDEYKKNNISEQYCLIDMNLTSMLKQYTEKIHVDFYWKSFIDEFISTLRGHQVNDFKVACFGITHVAFLIEKDHQKAEKFYYTLKDLIESFSFWRYFADEEAFLTEFKPPKCKLMPISSRLYLQTLYDEKEIQQMLRKTEMQSGELSL